MESFLYFPVQRTAYVPLVTSLMLRTKAIDLFTYLPYDHTILSIRCFRIYIYFWKFWDRKLTLSERNKSYIKITINYRDENKCFKTHEKIQSKNTYRFLPSMQ